VVGLAFHLRGVAVEAAGDLEVAQGLRGADLGGEIAEQRQLLHETEIMRPTAVVGVVGHTRFAALLPDLRAVRTLFAVELVEEGRAVGGDLPPSHVGRYWWGWLFYMPGSGG
jgi:hypothetical protein